ncbi:FAD:protein FMN transferase [Candidatus Peregrinibacteria bacterium]|nr:MAG: FAD:protein FMN transferase [Candidatus Peregrinibacteria bacterium]
MKRFTFEERHLGTPVVLQLVVEEEQQVAAALARFCFEECARIEAAYSRFLKGNALAALNAQVGEWTVVEEEFFRLLEFGERLRARSEGAFDLSVKSILEAWGYDETYSFVEKEASRVGPMELRSGEKFEVRISMPVELGGLGKGYAIDRMVNALKGECGELDILKGFCINAGGDLFVQGSDENGEPWRILFEHPTDLSLAIGEMRAYGPLALAASSPSRRQWRNGERHHLVDPRTGEPARKMLAVYTQAESALIADAYSTALFVLGFEKARQLVPSLPLEAMLVGPQGQLWRSEGFKGELYLE